jgi:hypothetical protein
MNTFYKTRKKISVVLSKPEVWAMFQCAKLLKHKILIGLLLWMWTSFYGSTFGAFTRFRF